MLIGMAGTAMSVGTAAAQDVSQDVARGAAQPGAPAAAPGVTVERMHQPALLQPALPEPPRGAKAKALHDALTRELGAGGDGALAAYAARDYQPIWMDAGGGASDAALILIDFLRRADEHALPVSRYRGDELASRIRGGAGDAAGLEAELTAAFLDYARDVSSGVLDLDEVDQHIHIDPHRPDPARLLAGAATAPNTAAYLDGLAPADPLYRRLVERYRAFRSVAGADLWGPPVTAGPTLRLGDSGPRVAEARARLTAMGDLDPNAYDGEAASLDGARLATADVTTDIAAGRLLAQSVGDSVDDGAGVSGVSFDPAYFDGAMEEALMRFQARHGLNQDGLIGPATLAQLNVSPRERAEQIAVNLERLRWMNKDLGDRHVLVNQAGFEMQVVERGRPVFQSRVIVGQPDWETPEFSETMTHMVVNPTWYVPMSIARDEILPKLQEDPDYLAKRGMRLVGADAGDINWHLITPDNFPGRVTQLPGDENALGSVKFMFPNRFSIYLHDTPNKQLFERDLRAFSHGCVRVEKPHEFAEYLLSGQVGDPGGYFDEVLAGGRERRIELERPLPVHLTYRSAWIDENGVEQFRGDIYARDAKIARALESAGVRILG